MSVQAIGQARRREEDPRLLRGRGRYADDVHLPREARGYVLRSPHAHARIRSIDVGEAAALPGVRCILTGDDVKARGLGALRPLMPRRRHVGRPLLSARSRSWRMASRAMLAIRWRSSSPRR